MLELVLASVDRLPLERLVTLGLAPDEQLLRWIEEAARQGWVTWVVESSAAGAQAIAFRDEARREQVLAAASPEEWRLVLAQPDLVASTRASANRAVERSRFEVAWLLRRALVCHAPPPSPGDAEASSAWARRVVEAARAFRLALWLSADVIDRALACLRADDRASEAVLRAARGLHLLHASRASDDLELRCAVTLARSAGDPALLRHVHAQAAHGALLLGRPHDAVALLEEALGGAEPTLGGVADPAAVLPEHALTVLAWSRAETGEHARGLALAQEMASAGARAGRAELVALADATSAQLHAARRQLEPARAYAEAALAAWSAVRFGPDVLWTTAVVAAWARLMGGELEAARAALQTGQRAGAPTGCSLATSSLLVEVLDRLETSGAAGPGLATDAELARLAAAPAAAARGLAARHRARRLARGGPDEAALPEIDALHAEAVALLRSPGSDPAELGRALEEAAGWALRNGRPAEAARLEAEAIQVLASVGLHAAAGPTTAAGVARAIAELARVTDGPQDAAGAWERIATALRVTLGIERCAWLEGGAEGPRVVAARGGSAWVSGAAALVRAHAPRCCAALPCPEVAGERRGEGRVLVVPLRRTRTRGEGWVCLEECAGGGLPYLSETCFADALGAAIHLALDNATLRDGLAAARAELAAARLRLEEESRLFDPARAFGEGAPPPPNCMVGDSPGLRHTLALVARVAPADTAVLIHGETGVGKELVAQEIHRLSARRDGPFVPVHVASLPRGLVASALFGHERGAFTGATDLTRGRFELADGGTLFLDEVGELDPEDQVRLLRVLQDGTFERLGGTRTCRSSFRLVAATNRDLEAAVKAGTFRGDLYFRLAAFTIKVPPLRDRRQDVPALTRHFLEAVNRKLDVRFEGVGERDMARLVAYSWPGNVRELAHVVERAALLSEPPRLRIPPLLDAREPAPETAAAQGTLEDAERRYLREVLARTGGRIAGPGGAADIAGLKPSTFYGRLDALGLRAELRRVRAAPPEGAAAVAPELRRAAGDGALATLRR